jgi:hypothetical protein
VSALSSLVEGFNALAIFGEGWVALRRAPLHSARHFTARVPFVMRNLRGFIVLQRAQAGARQAKICVGQGAARVLASTRSGTRAQRTRVHFCPQHWLLGHLDLY